MTDPRIKKLVREHGDEVEVVWYLGKWCKRYYKTEENIAFWRQALEDGHIDQPTFEHVCKPFHVEIGDDDFAGMFQGFAEEE